MFLHDNPLSEPTNAPIHASNNSKTASLHVPNGKAYLRVRLTDLLQPSMLELL